MQYLQNMQNLQNMHMLDLTDLSETLNNSYQGLTAQQFTNKLELEEHLQFLRFSSFFVSLRTDSLQL